MTQKDTDQHIKEEKQANTVQQTITEENISEKKVLKRTKLKNNIQD